MDRFRKDYTPTTLDQKARVLAIKEKAEELEALFAAEMRQPTGWSYEDMDAYNSMSPEDQERDHKVRDCAREANRCLSIALTRLEESVMWAVKAATTEIPQ